MEELRLRFFLKKADRDLQMSDLVVSPPERFLGFPGKPLPAGTPPIYQASATFPGVLEEDGIAYRDHSALISLIRIFNCVEQACVEFEKAGGVMYFSVPDDENRPFLGEPVKAKRFFRL